MFSEVFIATEPAGCVEGPASSSALPHMYAGGAEIAPVESALAGGGDASTAPG